LLEGGANLAQACSIWSPVIIAELTNPRKVNKQIVYAVDKVFYSMEDIKIKIKNSEIKKQGQAVEINIKLDIICLLADITGHMHLINREEIVKERIPLIDFNNILDTEKQTEFRVNIINLNWEGELSRHDIKIALFLDYMIIATREQIVRLSRGEEGEDKRETLNEVLRKIEEEIAHMEKDNQILRRKVFFYERNISSLKRGIRKVENRNAILNREVKNYQEILEKLQTAIRENDRSVNVENNDFKNFNNENYDTNSQKFEEDNFTLNLGSRIKRMFLNSF